MQARLTTKPARQVISAIQALDLESIKLNVMDPERGEGWTREYADSIELAYKNYLTMLVKYQDDMEDIALSEDVDEFWHAHILQTMKYADDCQRIFGNFLHHSPHIGKRTAADVERKAILIEKTGRLYQREFGNAQVVEYRDATERADKTAYCNSTVGGKAAYCNATVRADKAAYCNAAVRADKAAYCNATVRTDKAAYCNATVGGKAAYCNATLGGKAAYCNAAVRADRAAYCNATVRTEKVAYCNATAGGRAAYCNATVVGKAAYCNATVRTDKAAYCNATVAREAAYCNAAVVAGDRATPRFISANPRNSARHRLAVAA